MRKINKIIIHCTATPLSTSVESIRNYHLSLGYKDIGYHYLIDKHGKLFSGRSVCVAGAHCRGHNKDSIGIALIGGANGKFDFTFVQLFALHRLVHDLQINFPDIKNSVFGHNDFTKSKTCPNFNVKNFFNYESK